MDQNLCFNIFANKWVFKPRGYNIVNMICGGHVVVEGRLLFRTSPRYVHIYGTLLGVLVRATRAASRGSSLLDAPALLPYSLATPQSLLPYFLATPQSLLPFYSLVGSGSDAD